MNKLKDKIFCGLSFGIPQAEIITEVMDEFCNLETERDRLKARVVELEKDTANKCVALRDIGDANIRLFSAIHRARTEYISGPFDDDATIPKGFCLLREGAIQQLLSCTSITTEALKKKK